MTTVQRKTETNPQAAGQRKPLEGIRIVVAEDFLVLPWASVVLSELGAEVIRVEAATRMVSRRFTPFPDTEPGAEWWNESGTFSLWYRGKKSVVINMQTEQGQKLYHELVAISDVVATNFRADVQERLGMVESTLRAIKKDLIILNVTGFGSTGPWRNYGAFARTIDGYTGLSQLTGYKDGQPVRANASYMDMVGGLNWAQALILALMHRDKTGEGTTIDGSMYETGINCIGPALLEVQKTGVSPERRGNQHQWMAPHGVYKCKGLDRYVAIAVSTDEMWRTLVQAMGSPKAAMDARYQTVEGRWEARDELDKLVGAWTESRDAKEIFQALQKVGVAAAPVMDAKDQLLDPHLRGRDFFEKYTNPKNERIGTRLQVRRPYKFSKTGLNPQWVADFGEHNRYVLGDLLGHSAEEIDQYISDGIVSELPDVEELEAPPTATPQRLVESKSVEFFDPDYKKILGIQ